jgi:hypothetical protein
VGEIARNVVTSTLQDEWGNGSFDSPERHSFFRVALELLSACPSVAYSAGSILHSMSHVKLLSQLAICLPAFGLECEEKTYFVGSNL